MHKWRVKSATPTPLTRRLGTPGVIVAVAAMHLAGMLWLGRVGTPPEVVIDSPVIEVELVRPEPPVPPPAAPPAPTPDAGGGSPAAPSRVHVPPPPRPETPRELPAPEVPAPEQELVVGVAPVATPEPGMGLGGQGEGTGTGVGAGSGPGSGGSSPPRLVHGPSRTDLARVYPRQARFAGGPGGAQLRCRIRLDTRLDRCRVVGEDPAGQGFGAAALEVAVLFRFTPATRNGQPVEDGEITIGVDFPAGRPRR